MFGSLNSLVLGVMLIKIFQKLPIILLVVGLACVPVPKPAQLPVSEAAAEVEPLLAERRYSEAATALEEIAQAYPDSPLPLIKLGQIYLRQHRWLLAEDAFNRALARDLDNPFAKVGLTEAWFNQGRLAEALILWQELVDTHPQLPGVFTGLGQTRLWLGDFEAARQAFVDQQQHHFDPQAQWFLAALEAPLDVVAATDKLRSISTGENSADDLPVELLAQRDYLLDVLSPFTAESSQANVAKATGIALTQIELWPLANYALDIANEASEQADAETLSFLGYALAQSGRPALDIFEQAQQTDPDSALPKYFQGLYLRDQQAFKAAEAMFREALALDPDNAAIYVELGRTRAQQGDLGTAEEALLTAVEVTQKDSQSPAPWVQKVLAQFYADRGYRIAEAGIPAAEALIEVDDNAEAQALLGWMQFLAGNPVEGEASLSQALSLDPELIEARYYLARLFEAQGQTELAIAEYERVVDRDTSGEYRELAFEGLRRLGVE